MTITIHELAIDTFVHMLGSLDHLLDKASAHADTRKFNVADLVASRLSPDMFPLGTQVYIACHHAKDGPQRLMGREPPVLERGLVETFDQLRARVKGTLEYVRGIPRDAFDGAEQRTITLAPAPDRVFDMTGLQLLRDWTLPHFYFHIVTAYNILRAAGVEIGKRDYARHMAGYLRTPPR
jgi:uncharacterized protein